MKPLYLLAIVLITSDNVYGFKPNYAVKKQSKSIFSNKRHTETITPARYNARNHIKYHNSATDNFMPQHYFPDVDYPINILEASKPFYVMTGENNALLKPFSKDTITNFNSARMKPAKKKVKPENFNENKLRDLTQNNKTYKATGPENNYSTATKNLTVHKNIMDKVVFKNTPLDLPIEKPITSQPAKAADKENVKSEKMTLPESDSQEYYDYEDMYYDSDLSTENNTVFDNQVEICCSNDLFDNATSESRAPENADVSKNSTIQHSEGPENSTTSLEPDTCPLKMCLWLIEKNNTKLNTNIGRKTPKKISLGPLQNVKRRKFLKYMNKKFMTE